MNDCIYCKILAKELPSYVVYEDDRVLAFLDIHPVNPGHTLIIPKRHVENFVVTLMEDVDAIMRAAQKIAPAILKAVGAEAFNFTANNGKAAGQIIFHTHFHIIPRTSADGLQLWKAPEGKHDFAGISAKIKEQLGH